MNRPGPLPPQAAAGQLSASPGEVFNSARHIS